MMAFEEMTAQRFRDALQTLDGISEKRMMGGLCFFHNGNMLGGVDRFEPDNRFMFRVGKDREAEALGRKGAKIVELGGRRMGGLIFVPELACGSGELRDWVDLAFEFVSELPAK